MRTMGFRALGRTVAVLAGITLLATGCSSTPSTAGDTPDAPGATAAAGLSPSTILTASGSAGTYLTDYEGKALYVNTKETPTPTSTTCVSTCVADWPPLTLTSTIPKAGAGVTQTLLSTFIRADGTTQIAYNGHPLHHYKGDSAKGDVKGQGLDADGGPWYLVAPNGSPISS